MSRTSTIAITRTHTATYIGAKIAAAFREILTEIGLGAEALDYNWGDFESAMRIWMIEGSFQEATVLIIDKGEDKVLRQFAVPLTYLDDVADAEFGHDLATVKRAVKKAALESGADLGFSIVVWNQPWHTS